MTDRAIIEAFEEDWKRETEMTFVTGESISPKQAHLETWRKSWTASQAHTRKEVIDLIQGVASLGELRNGDAQYLIDLLSQPTKG